jgi:blue copper oxidase
VALVRLLTRVLVIGTIGALLLCGGCAAVAGWAWSHAAISTAGEVSFDNPLAIPPLAPSRVDRSGRRVFSLTADERSHDFGTGVRVPTWGFSRGYLGPTLRATRGERVAVEVHNDLAEPTTVHWHGMHLPARMDGGPHQPVAPGATWTPTWQVDQPAATLWYHPHPHGATARHVSRGLAGLFLVDDEPSAALPLPRRYGVDDIPVIGQDRQFDGGGRLDDGGRMFSGASSLGDTVVVNGTVAPYQRVTTERVRLRLLNASNARVYDFGFADDRRFALVGTDGGLLPAPYETTRIALSPGERAEIVVTVRPGERAVLRSTPPPLGLDGFAGRFVGGADTLDVLELRADGDLAASPAVPDRLVDVPRIDPGSAVRTRSFRMSGHQINGRKMDMSRVDAAVVKNSVEVWRVTNRAGMTHSFHVHDQQFQVVSVGGRRPPPQLRGWKDTVYLPPGVEYAIALRFGDYADPATPYMFHCHVLRHEDAGMMGQFVVVQPGQQPAVSRHEEHGGGHAGDHDHGG